jgi:hypothetical protein
MYWTRCSLAAQVHFKRILQGIMHAITVSFPRVMGRFLGVFSAKRRGLRSFPEKFFSIIRFLHDEK